MSEQTPIIKTENLTKRYENVTAVDGLNLEIRQGEVFGLLGPNGAGKTTTILMLLGLTEPTAGTATVAGYNATRNPVAVKRTVGYMPDNVGFYEELTGRENLRYTTALNAIPRPEAEERIRTLLERVGLASVADQRVGTYSRGMRQRLGIADVLVKDPRVVILDEPTNGIDPEGIREVLEMIRRLAQEDGRTVLVSSHMLHQMQQICDRVGIFVKGKLVAIGPIHTLGEQILTGQPVVLELKAEPDGDELVRVVEEMVGVKAVERQGDLLLVRCGPDVHRHVVSRLHSRGFEVQHLRLQGVGLDDVYRMFFAREGV